MATTKIATLIIRTLAKPISLRVKEQARQHARFRGMCMSLAQFMYRTEVKLRTNILGENLQGKHIRPLSEAKAIENGANLLAEGFLFAVAAGLIIGETWRSSRKEGRRREGIDEQLEELKERLANLEGLLEELKEEGKLQMGRTDELGNILERVVQIGLRSGGKDIDLNLPWRGGAVDSRSFRAESLSSSMDSSKSTSLLTSGVPDLSEKFKDHGLQSDQKDVSQTKQP